MRTQRIRSACIVVVAVGAMTLLSVATVAADEAAMPATSQGAPAPETAVVAPSAASNTGASATELMTRALANATDKEVRMLRIEYPPGGSSPSHRHDAQVFVYVLKGMLRMQVAGAVPVILKPGDTFYEAPTDVHAVSENASKTDSAQFLVFMIKDGKAPVSRPATQP